MVSLFDFFGQHPDPIFLFLNPLKHRQHRIKLRIGQLFETTGFARIGIRPGHGSGRHPDRGCKGRHVLENDGPTTDLRTFADGDCSQNL